VIAPRDEPALAAAVQKLAESHQLRASLGHAARERVVKTFTAARMAADVRSLYHRLAPTT